MYRHVDIGVREQEHGAWRRRSRGTDGMKGDTFFFSGGPPIKTSSRPRKQGGGEDMLGQANHIAQDVKV